MKATAYTWPLTALGRGTLVFIRELGRITLFYLEGFFNIFYPPFQIEKIVLQMYFIGVKSLFVIFLISLFTGMVLGLQLYYTLVQFGSEGLLGSAIALTLIRELGPVLTAIVVTGQAGSAMAAEIGIMRISEQVDALETMDIQPVRFLASPRIAASLICFPLLTAIFDVVGILGAYLTGCVMLGINKGIFFTRVVSSVSMTDVTEGFIKAFVFAVVVCTVCCYMGYTTHLRKEGHGARGVSNATTSSVVLSFVLILVADYILTSILV